MPLSVQAFSAEMLAARGIVDQTGLQQATPGLDVGEQAQFSTIFLRGVGSDAFLMADPSVASYIDGIYFPFAQGAFHAIIGTLSKSAFAQATLTVTDWLALTAGARYQDEARYLIRSDSGLFLSDGGFQTLFNWNELGARDGNGDPFPIRDTTTSFRPKATIELRPFDDRALLYFSCQEALKSGTYMDCKMHIDFSSGDHL
ncbi:MAG: hypothetical protein ACT4QA_15600 [Panacagrimonas sp.]